MVFKLNKRIYLSVVLIFCLIFSIYIYKPFNFTQTVSNNEKTQIDLPVIMYHHMLEKNIKNDEFTLTIEQFKQDMDYLEKSGYTTVSLEDVIDYSQGLKSLPKKPILITFDDGYLSVYKYAFPILKEKNMKAVALVLGYYTDLFSTDTPKHINYANLSWDELKEMKESGVFSIGNHSYNLHAAKGKGDRYGTTINKNEDVKSYLKVVGKDLNKFNKKMKEKLGVECTSFAYPFGAISEELTPFLNEKFKVIFTCDDRVNKITQNEKLPLILKRFNRSSKYSTYEFFKKFS